MIASVPVYVNILFILTTALAGWFFLKANPKTSALSIALVVWLVIQAFLAETGYYQQTYSLPPRILVAVGPPVLLIIACLVTRMGRHYMDQLDARLLTWLHSIRMLVELVLFLLMTERLIPKGMTFEGRNLDILSGLSAPFIAYFGYHRKKLPKVVLVSWNILCILLLLNVVFYGLLSAPYPFQQFSIEQPNVAVLYFPFIWLPSFIVPVVLFSHLTCLRQLLKANDGRK